MNRIDEALAILVAHRHLLNAISASAVTVDPDSPVVAAYRQASEIAGEVVWPGWEKIEGGMWRLLGAGSVHVERNRDRWFTFGVAREDGSTEPYGGEGYPTAGAAMLAVQRVLVGGAR